MTVITISRQYGSGGDEIADRVCKAMNFRQFDKRVIAAAAMDAGLSDQEIIDYSEENYKVKNFFDRLLRRPQRLVTATTWREDPSGIRVKEEMHLNEVHAVLLVQKAVEAAYRIGEYVIIGRGGQVILKDKSDVLHVRIEAPLEDRIQRMKNMLHQDKNLPLDTVETRRVAQDLIDLRDAASADYIKQFYGIDWSDHQLYHLILNTGKLSIDLATGILSETLRCLDMVATKE